ncbi:TetR family transcriptional regulator C-terminal domain-containing protein [Rathayibacter sp. ZW T2_19]|uniref:TetR family transcriptional regulator C-terminal domain-containing protein n=1 Tax=Rathayibacter rubneri TaxID=2950106 RepID=A0A9X2DVA0_9MICO|nr:TetR-like C-terminal domain-containing protein [Rathayibacter rubneri]MCM6761153.1 TetR family transcriptional regulator C-terminal domain-containing protein [Rathayibacter rubneri]
MNSQSRAAFGSYLAHIQENRDFYRWALVTRGSQRAVNAATSVYIEGISAGLAKSSENGKSTRELQRRAAYLAGAMTGVIRQWLSDDPAESAAELSVWLWRELTVAKE